MTLLFSFIFLLFRALIRAPEDFDVVVVTIFSRSVSSFLSTYLSGQVPTPFPFLVTLTGRVCFRRFSRIARRAQFLAIEDVDWNNKSNRVVNQRIKFKFIMLKFHSRLVQLSWVSWGLFYVEVYHDFCCYDIVCRVIMTAMTLTGTAYRHSNFSEKNRQ